MRPARNWTRPALLLGAVAVFWAADRAAGAAATVVLAALFIWSLIRQPWRPCWNCRGSGARYGRIWQGTAGRCRTCDGKKQQLRWGVRVLMPGYARRLKAGRPTRYGLDGAAVLVAAHQPERPGFGVPRVLGRGGEAVAARPHNRS